MTDPANTAPAVDTGPTGTVDPDVFLRTFFGPGNLLRWAAYEDETMPAKAREAMREWVEGFLSRYPPRVLPRVFPPDGALPGAAGRTAWYAFADDAREARDMREHLTAFVGPTYTDFTGRAADLNPADPIEAVCQSAKWTAVYRLTLPPWAGKDERETVKRSLRRLRNVLAAAPTRSAAGPRALGRMLREFESALLTSDPTAADARLEELRVSGRVGARNLAFLRLRRRHACGRPAEVLADSDLDDVLAVRRPRAVTAALADTLHHAEFAQFAPEEPDGAEQDGGPATGGDVTGAVARFRKVAGPGGRFAAVFRSADGAAAFPAGARLAFLLRAVAVLPPVPAGAAALAATFEPGTPDRAWADALLTAIPSANPDPDPTTPGEPDGPDPPGGPAAGPQGEAVAGSLAAARLAAAGNDDAALDLLLSCDPTAEVLGPGGRGRRGGGHFGGRPEGTGVSRLR